MGFLTYQLPSLGQSRKFANAKFAHAAHGFKAVGLDNAVPASVKFAHSPHAFNVNGEAFDNAIATRFSHAPHGFSAAANAVASASAKFAHAPHGFSVSGTDGSTNVIRTYVSDGDTNGIFYWLGTDGETTTFVNPATDGTITSTATSILGDDAALHGPNNLTDRLVVGNSNVATTKNLMINEAFTVDLTPTGYTYTIDRVTYRGRESFAHAPRNWAFEGSTDGVTWLTLAINENETALGGDDEGWFSNVITQSHPPLSYVRIIQTGAGSSGDLYLVMGEFEIYGTIYGV